MNVVLISCLHEFDDVIIYISHFVMNTHTHAGISKLYQSLNQPKNESV